MQGVHAHPQKFWFVENPGNIYENVHKTPENLGILPKNAGKNGAQRCLISKNWLPTCAESLEDLFWRSSQKKGFVICAGGNIRTNGCPKTFRACLGKFGQNIFRTPKHLLVPTPMSHSSAFYWTLSNLMMETKTKLDLITVKFPLVSFIGKFPYHPVVKMSRTYIRAKLVNVVILISDRLQAERFSNFFLTNTSFVFFQTNQYLVRISRKALN